MKFIDPRIDFAFYKIFRIEDKGKILISFFESLMGLKDDKCIREISLIDCRALPEIIALDRAILNIKCVDFRGVVYFFKIQIVKTKELFLQIQHKTLKMYAQQAETSVAICPKANQIVGVTITDFSFNEDSCCCVSCYNAVHQDMSVKFSNEVVYYFIELSKFDKIDKIPENDLDKWLYFIKMACKLEKIPEEMKIIPFEKAFGKALLINMNREESEYYDKACMAVADARGAIELAREEGYEQGRKKWSEKWSKEEKRSNAIKMLEQGMEIDIISKVTGLSHEEIQSF